MLSPISERITGITHPLIRDIYMKRGYGPRHHHEDVLVIETYSHKKDNDNHESFDSYLAELLTDLHDLQVRAEKQVGHIDRIDIKQRH